HEVFLYVETGGSEVDQESGFDPGGAEVAEYLRHVFLGHGLGGLEFHNQFSLDEKIGEVFTEYGAVFVVNVQGVLLPDLQALFAKPVGQSVFIHLFRVPVPMVFVQGKRGFPDDVAELIDGGVGFHFFVFFCAFSSPKKSESSVGGDDVFGLAAGAEVEDGHAHGDAVGHLIQNHAALAVGQLAVDLHPAVDRAGVHDDGLGVEPAGAGLVEAEHRGVFAEGGEHGGGLAFVLYPKKHDNLG